MSDSKAISKKLILQPIETESQSLIINNYSDLIEFINSLNLYEKVLFCYMNEKYIQNILLDLDEIIEINYSKEEKINLATIFYLSKINNREFINYKYELGLIILINNYNKNEKNNLKKIIVAILIRILINNFIDFDEEEENKNEIMKIENENADIIKNNFNEFTILKLPFKLDDILNYNIKSKINIDDIYIEIINGLIRQNKFEDNLYIKNILEILDLKNIYLTKKMFDDLERILNIDDNYVKQYLISKIDDLKVQKKTNFYYYFLKYIIKDPIYMKDMHLFMNSRAFIIKYLKELQSLNKLIFLNFGENKMKEKIEYIIKQMIGVDYYYNLYIKYEKNIEYDKKEIKILIANTLKRANIKIHKKLLHLLISNYNLFLKNNKIRLNFGFDHSYKLTNINIGGYAINIKIFKKIIELINSIIELYEIIYNTRKFQFLFEIVKDIINNILNINYKYQEIYKKFIIKKTNNEKINNVNNDSQEDIDTNAASNNPTPQSILNKKIDIKKIEFLINNYLLLYGNNKLFLCNKDYHQLLEYDLEDEIMNIKEYNNGNNLLVYSKGKIYLIELNIDDDNYGFELKIIKEKNLSLFFFNILGIIKDTIYFYFCKNDIKHINICKINDFFGINNQIYNDVLIPGKWEKIFLINAEDLIAIKDKELSLFKINKENKKPVKSVDLKDNFEFNCLCIINKFLLCLSMKSKTDKLKNEILFLNKNNYNTKYFETKDFMPICLCLIKLNEENSKNVIYIMVGGNESQNKKGKLILLKLTFDDNSKIFDIVEIGFSYFESSIVCLAFIKEKQEIIFASSDNIIFKQSVQSYMNNNII